jgi:hypothetical protein
MAKRTLLDMVQSLLSITDGDEVNSISDTIEAGQMADLIKAVYYNIVDEVELPHTGNLRKLNGLGDTDLPNLMQLPQDVSLVEWIKYDVHTSDETELRYADIEYKAPHDFVTYVNNRSSTDADNEVIYVGPDEIPLIIDTTVRPTYWTTFDDEYIVFDSYDSAVDSTLQTSKSLAFVYSRPTFTISDDFIPDLPENLFNYLYSQAEARAFAAQKQSVNPKSEQQENRSRIRVMRNKWRSRRHSNEGPDYGRN